MSRCAHRGASMAPTLRDGDLLELTTCAAGEVRVGDVVAMPGAAGEPLVVHRVVRRTPRGLVTRGDGAAAEDPWLTAPDAVVGRVAGARRGSRAVRVAGGALGRLQARLARLRGAALRSAAGAVRSVRGLLPPAGWAAGLLPAALRPRVVRFVAGGVVERRIMVGSRVAGRYDEARGAWRVRLRYRPFVGGV